MGRTVLVVDDDAATVLLVWQALEAAGYEVSTAADGAECLGLVLAGAPDLIVLDLKMPLIDGVGVLQHLRARPETRQLPVVVLTAHGDFGSRVDAWLSGAERFLRKPVSMEALVAEVKRLLPPSSQ